MPPSPRFARCIRHASALLALPVTLLAQTSPSDSGSASSTGSTIKLSPFEVRSDSSTGYGADYSSSSSRLNLRYIDVPQSVGVITSEFLNDAFIFDSREFTKFVPNVQPRANTHQPEIFYVRGLQISNTYVDGYIAPLTVNRDRALYDRIEYVKGPASAAMGRGEAGGLVNFISKTPLSTNRNIGDLTFGSDSFYRADFDHSARLTANGRTAYRIPIFYEEGDGPRGGKLMHSRKYGIGPSFRWDIGPKTNLLVNTSFAYNQSPGPVGEAYWQNNEQFRLQVSLGQINPNVNWNPFRGDAYVPKERVYGWAGRGRESEITTLSAFFTHKFSDSLSVRQGIARNDVEEEYRRFAMSPTALRHPTLPNDFQVGLSYMHDFRNIDSTRIQGDALYDLKIGSSSHQLLAGYDVVRGHNDTRSGQRGGLTQSLYNPDYTLPAGFNPDTFVSVYTTDSKNKSDGFGYFGQYSGSFFKNKLNVMYGWRKDKSGTETLNRRTNVNTTPADLETDVPRYSVSYKPVDWATIYYVHSEQADPRITARVYNNILPSAGAVGWAANDPRFNEVITSQVTAQMDEIGVKGSLLDNRLTASFALFKILRDGFILNDFKSEPGSNGVGSVSFNRNYVADGENARGFELELNGKLTKQLTLLAGVNGISGDKRASDGRIVPIEAMINSAMINARYDFRDTNRNGFELTAGGKLMFKGWVMAPGTYESFRGDQYLIDAGVNYSWQNGRYSVRVRCNNIMNDLVFISGNSQYALRRIFVSLPIRF
ncbi:MAG: TonB-dependent receptor plug domain-containing protein [Planctomycetaceae bacterium]|nr:TonB-dependent receptor plug domain-containing protein [Planctomycetaceae bacterium]